MINIFLIINSYIRMKSIHLNLHTAALIGNIQILLLIHHSSYLDNPLHNTMYVFTNHTCISILNIPYPQFGHGFVSFDNNFAISTLFGSHVCSQSLSEPLISWQSGQVHFSHNPHFHWLLKKLRQFSSGQALTLTNFI